MPRTEKEFKTMAEMRAALCPKFEETFFKRATSKFHRDKKKSWLKSAQLLKVVSHNNYITFYQVNEYDGRLTLGVIDD